MSKIKIALYGKKTNSTSLQDIIPDFLNAIRSKEVEVQVEETFYELLSEIKGVSLNNISVFNSYQNLWKDIDFFFTFGGDGTILSAITYIRHLGVPIVGVNTGRLGYLASINKKDLILNLDDIFRGAYNVSKRSLLQIETTCSSGITFPYALNELAIMRKETTSMITVDTYINGELLNSFWADGLIIATPTGSTGYSLSCNGPIISPNNRNLVITPVAPHNLNVRPIVITDNDELRLKINSRVPEYSLSLDARLVSLNTDVEVFVKKADFCINLVELKGNSYLETLRKKLFWGVDHRN